MTYAKICGIVCSLFLTESVFAQVRGHVVGPDGAGLPNVKVLAYFDDLETDQSGNFFLTGQGPVVRFSLPGYRPKTKLLSDLLKNPEIRLEQNSAALWEPPQCPRGSNKSTMSGWNMRFLLLSGTRVNKGGSVDSSTNTVCRQKECMAHGWGPLWGSRFPNWPGFFEGFRELDERDVYYLPDPNYPGSEYRGTRSDGTRMRWVGVFGESISYDH